MKQFCIETYLLALKNARPSLWTGCAAMVLVSGMTAANAQVNPTVRFQSTQPEIEAPISQERARARALFMAITSVGIAIDDVRLKKMEILIKAGQEREAARIATTDPLFYDIQLRDLARRMSTRDESVTAPISDFVALFVGVARDGINAKELLTGNFYYMADPEKTKNVRNNAAVPQPIGNNVLTDILTSNAHYLYIQNNNISLYESLMKVEGQKVTGANDAIIANPDPAGLLTTRAWADAHAVAGTNRRLVEYTFRAFMCLPISEWADASQPDDKVGPDVDRFPGLSNDKYQVSCKSCHAQMDGMRSAFAFMDYQANNGPRLIMGSRVVAKYTRNNVQFPEGFVPTDNSFVNYATEGKNADQFGWRGSLSGKGVRQFGEMIANSQGFSRCLVRQVFRNICKRKSITGDESIIRSIANEFESRDYQIRDMAEAVATHPACIGDLNAK